MHMDSVEEGFCMNTTPQVKYPFSPYKNRNHEASPVINKEMKFGGNLFSPSQEKDKCFLMSNIEGCEWRNQKESRFHNTPLSKEVEMQMHKRTPWKGFTNLKEYYSPVDKISFMSPKKDNYFGKGTVSSPFVIKSPILKQISALREQHTSVFEDAITKAEHSNLFSSKSNNIQ